MLATTILRQPQRSRPSEQCACQGVCGQGKAVGVSAKEGRHFDALVRWSRSSIEESIPERVQPLCVGDDGVSGLLQ